MKTGILVGLLFGALHNCCTFGQGTIDFINRNISTVGDPTVLYNVPLYKEMGRQTGEGAGNWPASLVPPGVGVGLFLAGGTKNDPPLISTTLRTGTPTSAQFFVVPATGLTATVPGVPAGATANLTVRAWLGGSLTYNQARNAGSYMWEWTFTSQPLGGTPPGGGTPIPTPGMTGWGPENGAGFELLIPEPGSLALVGLGIGLLLVRRRPKKSTNIRPLLLLTICALFEIPNTFGQGSIDFINRNIGTRADPTILYNVPIYAGWPYYPFDAKEGAGNLPGGVAVGLFLFNAAPNATPLIQTTLRTGTPSAAAFFVTPATGSTAIVPNVPAGMTANLTVRAWQGATLTYPAAIASGMVFAEWSFTSLPLGGTPPGGGLPIPTPGMTGWGNENGSGFEMFFIPEPTTFALAGAGLGLLLLQRRRA